MRLVVDTSVLVGELLRAAGRERLGDARLELFLAERMWGETKVEMSRRVAASARRRGLDRSAGDDLVAACLDAVEANVIILDAAVYAPLEEEASARSLRDPADWPVVASALVLSADIWTNDNDCLGTGVATWTTATLRSWLDRHPADRAVTLVHRQPASPRRQRRPHRTRPTSEPQSPHPPAGRRRLRRP